ncbi:MAG: hypothetical protein LRY55_01665 [Leadbetterella sp.]|nr:hypothetical protein [Leadbetterella sp.]
MASSSHINQANEHDKCVEKMVQSVLDGSRTIEELKARLEASDELPETTDELEKVIRDCLKNKVERKCCPEKIVNEVRLKIGIGVLVVLGLAINIKVIQDLFTI